MYHHSDLDEPPETGQACARTDHDDGGLGRESNPGQRAI